MSIPRLLLTSAAMAVVALALAALAPDPGSAVRSVADAQRTVDLQGADALVLSAAALAAWACWAWGAVGLALTAASAVPGALGAGAGVLLGVLLPAAARRAAAIAVGAGLAAPVLLGTPPGTDRPLVTAAAVGLEVPDWPRADRGVPDWPAASTEGVHVVAPGDCLWDIAEGRLAPEGQARDAEVAAGVQRWWSANRTVIGPDPDLIRPGQVLRPPPP